MNRRSNPAAAARAALIPRANALMAEGLTPPAAWGVVMGLVQGGEPLATVPAPPPPASTIDVAELHREALAIARERGCALSEAFRIAGGLPAGAGPTDGTSHRWWADSERLDLEAREVQRATGRPFGACFREVTERHALADRRAAAATFRERQERANAGDQVAARMAELVAGGMAAKPALLQAGRELAGAGTR
jgi:hypothetical protein